MEVVGILLIILLIIIIGWIVDFFESFVAKIKGHREEKQERKQKREFEKRCNAYFDEYKNSEFVKKIVADMKKHMPNPPYDWSCRVNSNGISGSGIYNFYKLGYENLSSREQIDEFARAIAYNLGSGFEIRSLYEWDCGGDSCYVYYAIKKPLKKI